MRLTWVSALTASAILAATLTHSQGDAGGCNAILDNSIRDHYMRSTAYSKREEALGAYCRTYSAMEKSGQTASLEASYKAIFGLDADYWA